MNEEEHVVYVGTDADSVRAEWPADSPYEITATDPSAAEAAIGAAAALDGVVVRDDDGTDVEGVLTAVADRAGDPLVVVLAVEDVATIDADEALARGVDHYLPVDEDVTPIDRLTALADRIATRRQRRDDETILRSLLEEFPTPVYVKDADSRHVRASRGTVETGPEPYLENAEGKRYATPGDVIGNSDFDLYDIDYAVDAVDDDREILETGDPLEERIEQIGGPVGEDRYLATAKAPWYDEDDSIRGVVGISRDVSERERRMQRLERQNARLDQFAKVISHDLRNPMEVVRGRLELARETGGEEHFDAAARALERMDALVDDVLTMARQDQSHNDPETVDLAAVAREAWDVVDSGDARIDVATDQRVRADPGQLSQLLENLFRNAIEHASPDDEDRRLTVRVAPHDAAEGFVVADDGVGIPDDERDDVLEPGFTTESDGTGLGLGIVRGIADAHGWTVRVAESDAGGARFEFANVTEME